LQNEVTLMIVVTKDKAEKFDPKKVKAEKAEKKEDTKKSDK